MVLLGLAGCKEQMDEVDYPSTTDELVTVSLNLGFADNNVDELYRNGSPQREGVSKLFISYLLDADYADNTD